jgi:catechol 2,3-dioxygenase-like lactoylglutathione lyase family enzyme
VIHHLSLGVTDMPRAARFYDACLNPLGYVRVWEDLDIGHTDHAVGYGRPGGGDKLCLKLCPQPLIEAFRAPGFGFHVAFDAPDRSAVDAFHAQAIASGGTDNGPPGLREEYGPRYYAAFVIDPDGHRIEAVINV